MKASSSILIISLWIISVVFFLGNVSLIGWYSDTIFLILTTSFLINVSLKLSGMLRIVFITISSLTILVIAWSTLTAIPVKKFSKTKNSEEYGYFIDRGNLGIISGCYGQVYFFKKIPYLPFLEVQTEAIECSSLPYECYIDNC